MRRLCSANSDGWTFPGSSTRLKRAAERGDAPNALAYSSSLALPTPCSSPPAAPTTGASPKRRAWYATRFMVRRPSPRCSAVAPRAVWSSKNVAASAATVECRSSRARALSSKLKPLQRVRPAVTARWPQCPVSALDRAVRREPAKGGVRAASARRANRFARLSDNQTRIDGSAAASPRSCYSFTSCATPLRPPSNTPAGLWARVRTRTCSAMPMPVE